MMVIISPAFSQTGVIKALLGGAGIGLTCVSRAAALGELLPSSSWSPVGTPAMILASFGLAKIYGGGALPESGSSSPSFFELDGTASVAQLVVAGVLVGAGSSVGGGCTSGNGIQGLAALSPAVRLQSLVFVLVFMASGVAAATLLQSSSTSLKPLSAAASASASATADSEAVPYELFAVACVLAAAQYAAGKRGAKRAAAAFGGAAFAASLVLSSMPKPSRVLGFLDVFNQERGWDPTLMFVMGGALVVALPMYQVLGLASRSKAIADWAARPVTAKGSLVGGVMFGCGWGLCGMCPGPGIVTCGAALASSASGSPAAAAASLLSAGGIWTAAMFSSKAVTDAFFQSSAIVGKAD